MNRPHDPTLKYMESHLTLLWSFSYEPFEVQSWQAMTWCSEPCTHPGCTTWCFSHLHSWLSWSPFDFENQWIQSIVFKKDSNQLSFVSFLVIGIDGFQNCHHHLFLYGECVHVYLNMLSLHSCDNLQPIKSVVCESMIMIIYSNF